MGAVAETEQHTMDRLPVPERPMFRLLQGGLETNNQDIIEEFDPIRAIVATRAFKFWGVEKVNLLIPRPSNEVSRLDDLNAVYTRVPSKDLATLGWRKKTTPKRADGLLHREVKLPRNLNVDEFETPITAVKLFDHPGINNRFLSKLSDEGNPQFLVVRAFENWRTEYNKVRDKVSRTIIDDEETLIPDESFDPELINLYTLNKTTLEPVSDNDLERGYRAFEQFLFSVDPGNFLKKLKAVSVDYLTLQH